MSHQFRKHYTREEATALLPQIRAWLKRLNELRHHLEKADRRVGSMMKGGDDIGGDQVNRWITIMAEMQEVLVEFQRREIQVKDMERGLVDFPAIIAGREVFLCWEQDEENVEFWHELDTGYSGRERLD